VASQGSLSYAVSQIVKKGRKRTNERIKNGKREQEEDKGKMKRK
jgi:hypothetical protein